MSTSEPEFNPEDYEGLNPAQSTISNAELRRLRKDRERRQELEEKVAQLERRDVFARAGIPVDDPGARYFVKGYDGELTPEAIKAAGIEARLLSAEGATPQEVAGHQAAQAAAQGGTAPTVGPDYQAKLAELQQKRFGPTDEVGRNAAMAELARLQREAAPQGIPIYPQS